jgi:O-methyltransferase
MTPPYPWGQWFYGDLLERRCAHLDGDVIEAGVGAGGMSFFLALTLKDLGLEKRVLAADSFQGLPQPHPVKDNPYFSRGEYGREVVRAGGLEGEVWLVAAGLGVGDMVVPVAGFFEDTLPHLDEQLRFCFVHVDADLYDSVLCALECLYDRLVDGGMIAIDDFFHPGQGPARAAAEFFAARGLHPTYHVVFPYAAVVVKGRTTEGPRRSVDGNTYSFAWLRRDRVFVDAVAQSAERGGRRARRNAELLLELLRTDTERRSDVYDYWRALEEFFEWTDVLPEERVAHRL